MSDFRQLNIYFYFIETNCLPSRLEIYKIETNRMSKTTLGEFEELVLLTVLILQEEAYILKIKDELVEQANRKSAMGALHVTLSRLEKKEFLSSSLGGATKERGGRRKRIYELTAAGKSVLTEIHQTRSSMWNQVPNYALRLIHV